MGAQARGEALIPEAEILRRRFSELLGYEKAKRGEQIVISLVFYALAGSAVILLFSSWLPAAIPRWWIPLLLFLGCAPFVVFKKRWRSLDTIRALAQTDKSLRLEERGITAWEALAREKTGAAEDLVVAQTEERLKGVNFKTLFQRQYDWQAYLVLPLLIVWLALSWLDMGAPVNGGSRLSPPPSLASKLREFARELQQKAQDEELRETMRFGRELEKVSERAIETKASEEGLKSELAGMADPLASMRRAGADSPSLAAAESGQALKDLKTELEAARDLLKFPNGRENQVDRQWRERLAELPQLKKQFDQKEPAGGELSQSELEAFLDRVEKQVGGELDRRALLEAQQFLDQLVKQGRGGEGKNEVQMAGPGKQDSPDDGERAKSQSNLPGKDPGRKDPAAQPPPQFPGGATTRVKGRLGEGQSSGVEVKGSPAEGKSEISQEKVVASYRRQAEAELNSERVPEGLKETIRNYFLSLGEKQTRRLGDKETGREGE